ncbi:MAG TPA: class I SAM-dependent methyltransferase [Thermoplasmata archaeon]|nr:class I SAM-dependent methyltransferase [Thermoplasmata archaeon]
MEALPVLEDKWCRARALDNPLRRWLVPAGRDLERLDPPPGSTAVDLGAGVGVHVPQWLERLGPTGRLYLVDPDPENLQRWIRRSADDARLCPIVSSAASIPSIDSEGADRVLLSLALCCLVEKERVMEEAWRVLRPLGRLLVTFPRSYRRPSARRPLRLSVEHWAALARVRPWRELAGHRGPFLEWHLLEKPGGRSGSSNGSPDRGSSVPRAVPRRDAP